MTRLQLQVVAGRSGAPFLLLSCERVAKAQQELRIDVRDLDALEMRLQQVPSW
jgi:hypothetical protein